MGITLILFICLAIVRAQSFNSSLSSARALDSLLQNYAYRAFIRPKTGVVYDGVVPSNLTGIKISAMRLRSGSLKARGVRMYKDFTIPSGILVEPYVERLALVYQNLGNWSTLYYPLPGYIYLAPVLGLLAYNAANISDENLPVLNITSPGQPISIKFSDLPLVPNGSGKCVWFDLHGSVNFSNVGSGNTCSTFQLGHFSVVVQSIRPPPALPNEGLVPIGGEKKKNYRVWIIVGLILVGLILLVLLGLLVPWAQRYKKKKKMEQMERAAEIGETLKMTSIGRTKAPAAMVTRTQPALETEYAP